MNSCMQKMIIETSSINRVIQYVVLSPNSQFIVIIIIATITYFIDL